MRNVVVIGIGGIGTHLVRPLCRYLSKASHDYRVVFIDGDDFQIENEDRQEFQLFGPKAEVLAGEMTSQHPSLDIQAKKWYVTDENIFLSIREGDIVFSCVDNHATRKLLSAHCSTVQNVVLISGGNDYSDGNVQVFIRQNGSNITPPLTHLHPEIENPQDKNPGEMSCEELAESGSPQLIFTNFLASAWMLTTFWKFLEWRDDQKGHFSYSEVYFDLMTGNARSTSRN